MKTQSNTYPGISQYDEQHVAVPVNIKEVTKHDEFTDSDQTFYEYDLLIVLQGKDEVETAINTVQAMMDAKAQERGYDNILSACTYSTSSNETFAAEGQVCVAWRDSVWATCYQILGEVQAGVREKPTLMGLLEELPKMEWPS